jgi:hypothetical protein
VILQKAYRTSHKLRQTFASAQVGTLRGHLKTGQRKVAWDWVVLRLQISEDKIIRLVPRWKNGKLVTKKYVAYGPVASISTGTTQLQLDDATTHIAISLNEAADKEDREILLAGRPAVSAVGN